ncbi:MAG TPA: SgcJ/EcaC family oxidoreductase [Alphaproteobacteria bacterium]|nr:SgcJ/EcaC family oxidoreductase [Alphaproteobacteria bacterium]
MRRKRWLVSVVAGGLLTAMAAGIGWAAASDHGPPNRAEAARMIAEAKPAIEAANKDWLPAMQQQDAKRLAAPYAEDGIFLAASGAIARGRAAIEQMYLDRFAKGGRVVSGKIIEDGLKAEAGFIIEWGHAVFTLEQNGARRTLGGNYLTVWRRSAAGSWEITRNLTL